ncbi:aspartate/glutamate racemase family protein [Anaerocolumna sp. MB42-C2]|uniref:aspartate/glutamate racemase family protein n=1 Tax=Anaerocolumna sp. MB42-C2 TaxID=3070997 RepID=UPI0027E1DA15|nr:amino acid racemase [Anaerocolumna sp. MB42-C2]WMJ87057.1 amino acid racemase [Anaerocolumna sp. MB42-C2]
MKTIGLIGGMSWQSTITYYKIINETIKEQLGGLHSAKCLLYSVDFEEIEKCQSNGEWEKSGNILSEAAISLEKGGADFIIICTNTMHKVVQQIQSKITVPIVHIAEATAEVLIQSNIKKVALLGTKYTMTQDFYKMKLINRGIDVLIPEESDIEKINSVIFEELCIGIVSEKSRNEYIRIVDKLSGKGAQGVILGCTEIGLLLNQLDVNIPLFDTTVIHATKAALMSIEK